MWPAKDKGTNISSCQDNKEIKDKPSIPKLKSGTTVLVNQLILIVERLKKKKETLEPKKWFLFCV